MFFSIRMKAVDLLENGQACAILDRLLPGLRKRASDDPPGETLSVVQWVRSSRYPGGEALLEMLDRALFEWSIRSPCVSPAEEKLMADFRVIDEAERRRPRKAPCHTQTAFRPGRPWLDTRGERIEAHGGEVFFEDGVYYWYGENKAYSNGRNGVWTWGIRVYSSRDLLNWEDLGFLIRPVLDDPNSALFPAKRLDRPHILKCPETGKYVCWIKMSGPEAAFTVLQADRLLGPYTMVENLYRPNGYRSGDFDLVCDPETGKGYLFFDADHSTLLSMALAPDFLHADRELQRNYPDLHPPFTREGPALFEKDGKKYLFTSGMTGYVPNKSDCAESGAWDGPFLSIGDPHRDDQTHASYNSQDSKVFRVAGTDTLIAMADRWLPDRPVDARLADLFSRVTAWTHDPDRYPVTDEERREVFAVRDLDRADTSRAEYVWLPVLWENGRPVLRWMDSWTL